jgi:hypothetical protein
MTSEEIDRNEALRVFAKRMPWADLAEVERVFDQYLSIGGLAFNRDSDGQLHITLGARKPKPMSTDTSTARQLFDKLADVIVDVDADDFAQAASALVATAFAKLDPMSREIRLWQFECGSLRRSVEEQATPILANGHGQAYPKPTSGEGDVPPFC